MVVCLLDIGILDIGYARENCVEIMIMSFRSKEIIFEDATPFPKKITSLR